MLLELHVFKTIRIMRCLGSSRGRAHAPCMEAKSSPVAQIKFHPVALAADYFLSPLFPVDLYLLVCPENTILRNNYKWICRTHLFSFWMSPTPDTAALPGCIHTLLTFLAEPSHKTRDLATLPEFKLRKVIQSSLADDQGLMARLRDSEDPTITTT